MSAPRISLANVVRGKVSKPLRVVLYGVEGVGKSTFAADAPGAIFLCAEDGVSHLDVARFPSPRTWSDVLETVRVLGAEEHPYQTLVVDTIDWLEPLVWAQVCQTGGKASIEDFGFAKGYVMALELWRAFLARLEVLERAKKMHVVLVGHSQIKRVDDPHTGAFDRYRLKIHEKASDVLREWADVVLFARHESTVAKDPKTHRYRAVASGSRVVHTQWAAAFDAKNRFGLPATMALDWNEFFAACVTGSPGLLAELRAELASAVKRLPDEDKARAESAAKDWAGDDPAKLARLLDRVRTKLAAVDGGES